jgi:hypothetical protein
MSGRPPLRLCPAPVSPSPAPPPSPRRDPVAAQAAMVAALAAQALHEPDGEPATTLETHISRVLLAGAWAYKIKKPVALGFLDFRTLAARRHFCDEELRLNRRLAPDLYRDVVAITGTPERPVLAGSGPVLDYAVRMRRFAQDDLLPAVLARGELAAADIDALAAIVTAFHARIERADPASEHGTPETILRFALQNFAQLAPLVAATDVAAALRALETWTRRVHAGLTRRFAQRRRDGFVRECHGDLHLGNIARIHGRLTVFDALEFDPALRFVDTVSEIAFVAMDLEDRGRADYAHRFVDAWLAASGDYDALPLLSYYLVYRALVRAKVAALRAQQLPPGPARTALHGQTRGYVALATRYAAPGTGAVVVMHGLAGAGKSTAARALVEATGAIRVASDVERKRLAGLPATAASGSGVAADLYAAAGTERTYARLAEIARAIVESARVAVVDATFLARRQRDRFRALAASLRVPFVLVALDASEAELRTRIDARRQAGGDPSEADAAVLAHQIATCDPLAPDEVPDVVAYHARFPAPGGPAAAVVRAVTARLAGVNGERPANP